MKILVLYYSKGGNTRKLAEAVADGAGQVEGVTVVLRNSGGVTRDDLRPRLCPSFRPC